MASKSRNKKAVRHRRTRKTSSGSPLSANLQSLQQVFPGVARAVSGSESIQDRSKPQEYSPIRFDVDTVVVALGTNVLRSFLVDNHQADLQCIRLMILLEEDASLLRSFIEEFDISSSILAGAMLVVLQGEGEWNLAVEVRNRCIASSALLSLAGAIQVLGSQTPDSSSPFFQQYLQEVSTGFAEGRNYYGNDPHDSLVGIENMFDNLDIIAENPGINLLHNKFVDVPAFIVATGPSLDEALPHLSQASHKGLVIACDASVKPLAEAGVDFQFVASVERKPLVSKFFETFDSSRTYLFTPPLQSRHTLERFQGRKIVTYRNVKHFDWIQVERGKLDIKTSVANMAYVIADYLGCNPIVLIGQDLSFGDEGSTHATGFAIESATQVEKKRKSFAIENNQGRMVQTHHIWYSGIKSFETDIAASKADTINTTLRGARIRGAEVRSLPEVLAQLSERESDYRSEVEAFLEEFQQTPSSITRSRLQMRLAKGIHDCQQIAGAIETAREQLFPFIRSRVVPLLNQATDHIPPTEVQAAWEQMQRHKQAIAAAGSDTWECLVMHVFQSSVLDELILEKQLYLQYQHSHMAQVHAIARFPQWSDECLRHTTSVQKVLQRAASSLGSE
ncbi:motility associated factor glycosyltransferase family protein [Desulfurispira natronophila]|uniref:6-hydroxymethylpterin diphosphokinase MptE-like domain-containing protein n=1 Tax=Desulfurispira natronophila TaxID=682562 RepID=A0A7W7Y334_9BACT|nr:6-hydroxymethylpterin diphosphokinase MptE-like protein [Desulfurispira natronophila]MBB5021201.1 hypothetical protein [Desulfurispira natronophila]